MISEVVLLTLALFISIPLVVTGLECLIAFFVCTDSRPDSGKPAEAVIYKILIPAHNEAGIIHKTLTRLIAQLPDADPENIVVVADNCSDETAKIARALKVTVLERRDAVNRGKGFALDFGIRHILNGKQAAAVVVVIDADCETDRQSIVNLIAQADRNRVPVQMVNIMRVVNNASIKQKVAGFAWLVKNKIRPMALAKLGLPVPLTGTGMAFPRDLLPQLHLGSANIVEDTQLGIDCAINGSPPQLCAEATIFSDFPAQASAEMTQRTRWEHGHLQTIIQQVPRLLKHAVTQKKPALLAMALDVGIPPLSLLVMLAAAGLAGIILVSWFNATACAATILAASFVNFASALTAVWWRFGRDYLSAKELLAIPFYVLAKLSIYAGFLSKRQKDWVRTERDS